jgi:glycine cleavage system transcriptional repressor
MKTHAVLSAIGPDRPGLVATITDFLLKCGANVEDSRMAVLGGDFAVILLFSVGDADFARIEREKERLAAATGLALILRRTESRPAAAGASLVWQVKAVALDHPGIVYRLSEALAQRGINILELESHVASAPVSGTPVFSMDVKLSVPAAVKASELRAVLAKIGDEECVDIEIRPEA